MIRTESGMEDLNDNSRNRNMSRGGVSKSALSELSKSWAPADESMLRSVDPKTEAYEKVSYLASICIKYEKYEDAVRYVDEMVKLKETELTEDERNIVISAYKYYISEKRKGWRVIFLRETKEQNTKLMMNEIKSVYEDGIIKACDKFINLINNYIMNKTKSDEGVSLFLKVKADHYRYMAEITNSQALFNNKQNAFNFYKQAYEISTKLDHLNPIKLGIALNYSVFLYEILNRRINAIFYSKEALSKALIQLKEFSDEELAEETMKESLTIIEIMNQNVHEWYNEEMERLKGSENKKENDEDENNKDN